MATLRYSELAAYSLQVVQLIAFTDLHLCPVESEPTLAGFLPARIERYEQSRPHVEAENKYSVYWF